VNEGGNKSRYNNDSGNRNRYGNEGGNKNRYGKDGGKNRYANKDRDNKHHGNRHRVFRNGVWVWVYGPDYAYGYDCDWLRRRAAITGSPYWWDRYNACIGYDYY
jgi:hypothetical protein